MEDAAGLGRRDARRVLPAVLQQKQRVVDLLIDRALPTTPTIPHMGVAQSVSAPR
jgi:hypothetical protein